MVNHDSDSISHRESHTVRYLALNMIEALALLLRPGIN
jgi:hypothetical protein